MNYNCVVLKCYFLYTIITYNTKHHFEIDEKQELNRMKQETTLGSHNKSISLGFRHNF